MADELFESMLDCLKKSRLNWLIGIACVVMAFVSAACHPTPRSDSADPFIEAMRDAYQRKDVDAVMALTADPDRLANSGIRSDLRQQIKDYNRDQDRAALEREFERGGMWPRAWSGTKFVSSREHADHIHVAVKVQNAASEVVLVRQDGSLKLHPRPGFFKCALPSAGQRQSR
jgi:hypothetical protein